VIFLKLRRFQKVPYYDGLGGLREMNLCFKPEGFKFGKYVTILRGICMGGQNGFWRLEIAVFREKGC